MRDETVQTIQTTESAVGQLLPILVNKRGEVIDGRHRLKANAKWKRTELDLDELQTHVVRLAINAGRRTADRQDYNELAEYLVKCEGLRAGQIASRIAKLTGIAEVTVRLYLDNEYKREGGRITSSIIQPSERVFVPPALVKPVQRVVEAYKERIISQPKSLQREEVKRASEETKRDLETVARIQEARKEPAPELGPRKETFATFMRRLQSHVNGLKNFLDLTPIAALQQIIRDMDAIDRKSFDLTLKDLGDSLEKLRKAEASQ